MPLDPEFEYMQQRLGNGIVARTVLTQEEYEQGVKTLIPQILKYFTDDTIFQMRTPIGPDAGFEVEAARITRSGEVIPGKITLDVLQEGVTFESPLYYSRWRYHTYDTLLHLLHGTEGVKPFEQAMAVINKAKNPPQVPKDLKESLEKFGEDLKKGIDEWHRVIVAGPKIEVNDRSTLSTFANIGVRETPEEAMKRITDSIEQMRVRFEKIDEYMAAHPGVTSEEATKWYDEQQAKKLAGRSQLSLSYIPRRPSEYHPPAVPTLNELLPEYDADTMVSPTEAVIDVWTMMFTLSDAFEFCDVTTSESDDDAIISGLAKEIAELPLANIGGELKWVIERIKLPNDADHYGSEFVDQSQETVAITVPTKTSPYQFYWSSLDDGIWARKNPLLDAS